MQDCGKEAEGGAEPYQARASLSMSALAKSG
jgi:hypothetical protein